jgi:hypothetical protein
MNLNTCRDHSGPSAPQAKIALAQMARRLVGINCTCVSFRKKNDAGKRTRLVLKQEHSPAREDRLRHNEERQAP